MGTAIVVTDFRNSTLDGRTLTFAVERITLGRRPDNQVVFDAEKDRAVSGHHAELSLVNGHASLRDLGSQNGVYLNGQRITGPVQVGPGDTVRLGQNGPEFRVRAEVAGAALAATVTEAPKTGIGKLTLEKALDRATITERRRSHRSMAIAGVSLLILLGGSLAAYAIHDQGKAVALEQEQLRLGTVQGDLDKRVAAAEKAAQEARSALDKDLKATMSRYDEELRTVSGKLSQGEGQVARLMVEIQSRDDALGEIRKRQDLSEEQRKKLIEETEGTIRKLGADLTAREESLRKDMKKSEDWAGLVEAHRESMFLFVAQYKPDTQGNASTGIGTGFCIRKDGLLATNSHVAAMFLDEPEKLDAAVAIQNGTGKIFPVTHALKHPDYSTSNSPDVALVRIDAKGAAFKPFELASDEDLGKLRIGTHLGTMGYPGEMLSTYLSSVDAATGTVKSAQATFKDGWIGRILNFNLEAADFADSTFIQHSASLSGGTSGSPVFTADGKVIAVHNSGRDVQGQVDRTPSAAQICFAIRVDLLRGLVASSKW